MKVLVAPDKFKGSLTAAQVAHHLGRGLEQRGIDHHGMPVADGGDGSVEAAIAAGFRPIKITVASATGHPHLTVAAFDGTTAVVEVASSCGLQSLPAGTLAPLESSSHGLGQAVRAVLALGASRVVLALGGSASTDGGAGMLVALGAVFLDENRQPIQIGGGSLARIRTTDMSRLPNLSQVEIVIACDVQNPLTGPGGAAAVYGPQKGATPADVQALDAGLIHLVECLAAAGIHDVHRFAGEPGAGAAGGLGFAGMLLGGRVVSGADYFLDLLGFETHLKDCDLVITGEGKIDDQTLSGKLPAAIARRAGEVPVIAVVGASEISRAALRQMGIVAVHAISDHTAGNPAGDPALSGQLLEKLGATIHLPQSEAHTGSAHNEGPEHEGPEQRPN
jgi:glycerate kinase